MMASGLADGADSHRLDDNRTDQRLLRDALESEGYTVEEAADGTEGLKTLFTRRPNVVVLDVLMPNMDGWTVCQRIRDVTDVPIIMLTSLDRDEEVVRGLELGADDLVSKPVSPRQLIARASKAPSQGVAFDVPSYGTIRPLRVAPSPLCMQ